MLFGNLATGPWHQVPIDDALLPLDCLVSQFRCDVLLPEQPSLWRKNPVRFIPERCYCITAKFTVDVVVLGCDPALIPTRLTGNVWTLSGVFQRREMTGSIRSTVYGRPTCPGTAWTEPA